MQKQLFQDLGDKELLTLCLYGEARGEPPVGKLAVAHVVLNRVARPCWWGKTLKEVILKPQQFSCFNPSDPNVPELVKMAASGIYHPGCLAVAVIALEGFTKDPTGGATHYCTVECHPAWEKSLNFLKQINRHRFYREGK